MRRLYFLIHDVNSAKQIVNELLLARIHDNHIHVVAREGVELEDLPEATFLQKSDFIPALERGAAVGGVTGILSGLIAMTFPPLGLVVGGGAIMATTLFGAGIGAWVSSMIGVDVRNSQIKQFEEAINQGEVLMMIDVPAVRVEEIESMVKSHHPEADIRGTEPTIPAFP